MPANTVPSTTATATASAAAAPAPARPPRRLRQVLSLDDFERLARRHLPRPIHAYISGAVEDNASLADNRRAFAELAFVPRALVGVAQRDPSFELFGRRYGAPFGVAPMGIAALSAYRGDLVLAQAAQQAGVPAIMSGSSLIRLEEVMAAAPHT
ncbi:MAG TPA: alpha-hydroxy-acid oxidizing enzyme, partial [Delftia acidovorans]|nr:alpha-hydroxy-acid oxidizing enzyme [Delftia acidovorans]